MASEALKEDSEEDSSVRGMPDVSDTRESPKSEKQNLAVLAIEKQSNGGSF
jgi:hypothetical protein